VRTRDHPAPAGRRHSSPSSASRPPRPPGSARALTAARAPGRRPGSGYFF